MTPAILNKPNSNNHNPSPAYLRGLLHDAALTQREAASIIGISDRAMRYYLSDESAAGYRAAPYPVQYALEMLTKD